MSEVGRRRNRRILGRVGIYALLIGGAVLAVFPLLWMVSASFMATGEASTYPPHVIPRHFTLDNYRALFTRLALGRSLANSALISLLPLFTSAVTSYVWYSTRWR